MFKYLVAAYWIIGCAVIGAAYGGLLNKCPDDKHTIENTAQLAATWPVYLVAALVITRPMKKNACKSVVHSRFDPV